MKTKHVLIGLGVIAVVGFALYLVNNKKEETKSKADGDNSERACKCGGK